MKGLAKVVASSEAWDSFQAHVVVGGIHFLASVELTVAFLFKASGKISLISGELKPSFKGLT